MKRSLKEAINEASIKAKSSSFCAIDGRIRWHLIAIIAMREKIIPITIRE